MALRHLHVADLVVRHRQIALNRYLPYPRIQHPWPEQRFLVNHPSDRLAKADPGNADWQRDLAVSYDNVGKVQEAQGHLPEALKSYQASHDIRDRLAKAGPGNADWQRDLAVSDTKVGNVQMAQGHLPEALKSYQARRPCLWLWAHPPSQLCNGRRRDE
jgi:hypothetical protein